MHKTNNSSNAVGEPMIERNIFCDLTLDEVAMILHTFLKKLEGSYQTVSTHIEKIEYDITDGENIEKMMSVERYILIIVTSTYHISSKELMKVYEDMMKDRTKRRSYNG